MNVARGCIIEIGRELIAAKAQVRHGEWLPWLDREFGWSADTAQNYMRVASAFQIPNGSVFDALTIDAKALYTLSAPDVPQPVRDEAIERAQAGDHITAKDAQDMVARALAERDAREAETVAARVRDLTIRARPNPELVIPIPDSALPGLQFVVTTNRSNGGTRCAPPICCLCQHLLLVYTPTIRLPVGD